MHRREFAQLAVFGVASVWLPACSNDSSGAPLSPQPKASGALAGATGPAALSGALRAESQLVTGTELQSFAPDGRAFAASPFRNYIDFLSSSGIPTARVGDPSRVPTRALGDVNGPVAVAWDDAGQRLLVLEQGNARIQAFDAAGASLGVLADDVSGSDLFVHPGDRTIYVASTLAHRIDVFAANGSSLGTLGQFGTSDAGLNGPASVVVAGDGSVHVVDMGSALVKVFGVGGQFVGSYGSAGIASSGLVGPRSVRIDAAGRVWVADTFGAAIFVYNAQGGLLSRFTPTFCDGDPAAPTSLGAKADGTIYAALIAAS
jgi:hypothetical protein